MLIEKSRSGVYQDTSKNRRLHRVGQRYGEQKLADEKKGNDNIRDVEIVTSKSGIKAFLSGKVGGDYYRAVAEAHKALKRSGKSKSVSLMLAESGSGEPSKDVPARKYVEAVADGASHDEAVAFADDCYKELLSKIQNVQEKVHSEGVSSSTSTKMFAAVNKWFNAQKFERRSLVPEVLPEVKLSEKAFMRYIDKERMEEHPHAKVNLCFYQAPEVEYFDNAGNRKKAAPFINEFYANSRQDSIGGYEIYFDRGDSIGTFRTKGQAVNALNRYINAMRVKDHTEPEQVYHQSRGQYQWNYSMPTSPSINKQKEQELKNKIADSEARRQAEKIDRGVRAAEEKRNLEEIKRTNEKINAAMKEQSDTDRKLAETSEKPISRVTFADVPHAKDVNLKKYLTDSRRKDVDRLMQAMDGMPKTTIKHAHDAAVTKFNDNFDSMKKSERASALYVIMKYKDLMNRSGKSLGNDGAVQSSKKSVEMRESISKRMSDAKVSFGSIEDVLREGAKSKSGDSGAYAGDIEVDLGGSYNEHAWNSSGRNKPKKTYQLIIHTKKNNGMSDWGAVRAFNDGTLTRDQIESVTLAESNPWEGYWTKIKDVDFDDMPIKADRK